MRIASYNILDPVYAERWSQNEGLGSNGKSNWEQRKYKILGNIKNSASDVVCMQEISPESLKSIQAHMSALGYELAIYQKHKAGVDGVAIFYINTPGVKLIHTHHSETGGRAHVIADFNLPTINKVIRVATCHLFGGMSPHAPLQIQDLCKLMEKPGKGYDVSAQVISGDFNKDDGALQSKDSVFQTLHQHGYLNMYPPYEVTENPNSKNPEGRRIDWILAKSVHNHDLKQLFIPQDFSASDHRLIARDLYVQTAAIPHPSPLETIPQKDTLPPVSEPGHPLTKKSSGKTAKLKKPKKKMTFLAAVRNLFRAIRNFFRRLFS